MVSAANGAEPFYTVAEHACRSEGIELAQELDQKAAEAWIGHPYFDILDKWVLHGHMNKEKYL